MNRFSQYLLFFLGFILSGLIRAEEAMVTNWDIHGVGWVNARQLTRQLQAILPTDQKLDANDIEDAGVILLSLMQQKGFLDAKVVTHLRGQQIGGSGQTQEFDLVWDRHMEAYLKQDLLLDDVSFEIVPGPGFFYQSLIVREDGGLDDSVIKSFFHKEVMLFQRDRVKVFNGNQFQKACRNLETYLVQLGYQDALVTGEILSQDWLTGGVEVAVGISKGPLHLLNSVEAAHGSEVFFDEISFEPWLGNPYSRETRQDIVNRVRNAYYLHGYPDVVVGSRLKNRIEGNRVFHDLELDIQPGNVAKIGRVSIEGIRLTRESFVRKKMDLLSGQVLNPIQLDRNRLVLSQTGLFDDINVKLDAEGDPRNITYYFEERFPWTLDFILGWGSYEQLRFGSTLRRDNLWGQAHQAILNGVVSFKSLYAEGIYSIPDVRQSGINFAGRGFSLDREENAFDRKERGVDVGITKRFERVKLDASLVYTLEILQSIDRQMRDVVPMEDSQVASLGLRLSRDLRDSPIAPQAGYRAYSNLEWADRVLGGNVSYLIGELGVSYHHDLGGGLFLHVGISGGILSNLDSGNSFIPTNKLYYPGGDDSIRGYQRGEAAPKDENGFFMGATRLIQANLELEQYLTENISTVIFYDWLGTATENPLKHHEESLDSVGIGLRWNTVIGPVRLEYGHNLNRRELDPVGTFHLAIGFPF